MTSLSRRAFVTAAMASLLVSCGGHGTDSTPPEHPGSTPAPSRTSAKAAHVLGRSVPVGLRIPAIGVDTPVMQLGLAADGSVQVPRSRRTTGRAGTGTRRRRVRPVRR